jgi:hypothetical protein
MQRGRQRYRKTQLRATKAGDFAVIKQVTLDPDADEDFHEKMNALSWEAMEEHSIVHIEFRKKVE